MAVGTDVVLSEFERDLVSTCINEQPQIHCHYLLQKHFLITAVLQSTLLILNRSYIISLGRSKESIETETDKSYK